jgi:cyclopropane fatty-acyl-phospholipid synthase-like methyltransferase
MSDSRVRTVQAGYDALGPRFAAWGAAIEGDPWERLLGELGARLPDGARVLDLGCGSGEKTQRLAERFEVVGVDVSEEQLGHARARVPAGTFLHCDFSRLELPEESFDAVTAFYSITHVPREEHAQLFARIGRWLKPGGLVLASLSAGGSEDWTGNWLGVEMFFSGFDADTSRRLLREAGFELLVDEVVAMREPEGQVAFLWALARKATS